MSGPLDHVQLKMVRSIDDAMEFKRWLGERRSVLGFDTESGGLSPERNRLRLAQFGDMNTGWAIPWERWSGVTVEALQAYEGPLVAHNLKFDVRFTEKHAPEIKWPWHRSHDTMTMAHLLNPLRPKGLKPLAGSLVDRKAVAAQKLLDDGMSENKWTWDTVPIDYPYYWIYGAMDPVLTCHIYEKLKDDVEASYKVPYDLEIGTLQILSMMEAKGALIDQQYCHDQMAVLDQFAADARVYMRQAFGIQNVTSSAQVVDALDRFGVEYMRKKTPGGAQSMDKEVYEDIDHPIGQYLAAIKKAERNKKNYLGKFLEFLAPDGRLHPSIWGSGARTSRMSISDPPMQQLPREDALIRGAIIPTPGNVLVSSDYDQIELRLMAHFSQDEGLIEAFQAGGNFFVNISSEMFGREIRKSDPEYGMVKTKVYAGQYGAGIEKMAKSAKITPEKMQEIENAYNRKFPGVKRFMREVEQLANQRLMTEAEAYIRTPLGRKLHADDGKLYTLVNYILQGHAAEVLKMSMVSLHAAGMSEHLVLPVHDELVADVPREDAEEYAAEMGRIMQRDDYLVPLTAGGEIIDGSWGSKYA